MISLFCKDHRTGQTRLAALALSVALLCGAGVAAAEEPDWTTYNRLLLKYISEAPYNGERVNMVRYSRLRRNALFHGVVEQVENYPLERLEGKQEEMAFYINAFNLFVLRLIVDNWPVNSIRDVGQFLRPVWDKPAGTLGGKSYSLDSLMNEILRKYGDPRVHFGVNCGSMGCPSFRREAYTAARLDAQLDDQIEKFFQIRNGFRYQQDRGRVRLSKHFRWFRDDFEATGGIESFVRRYQDVPEGLDYDPSIFFNWDINGR